MPGQITPRCYVKASAQGQIKNLHALANREAPVLICMYVDVNKRCDVIIMPLIFISTSLSSYSNVIS